MIKDLFSPGELQRCLLCGVEYEPAVNAHACEIESDWTGCYRDSWKGLITPDAFAHPAKFSRSLIHRIYAHAVGEHWLAPGSTVVDPFGGVALGGLEAAWHGAHWVGRELESKFVGLGNQNIALWNARFGHMPTWGSVRLVQGDSRQLSSVLERAGLCVSSPPFGEALTGGGLAGKKGEKNTMGGSLYQASEHGADSRNLGNLPATDTGLRIAISSPPYAGDVGHDAGCVRLDDKEDERRETEGSGRRRGYGSSPGQLGAMVVSSPPFEESNAVNNTFAGRAPGKARHSSTSSERLKGDYQKMGSIGSGKDFWSAAREIVAQTYAVLAPGAHAIWVLKGFIRKKQYADFPDRWRQLCEACGFITLHWHRAWLVEPGDAQASMLDGHDVDYTKERKSFFRRLAERKGSPRIDFEVVLCTLKE